MSSTPTEAVNPYAELAKIAGIPEEVERRKQGVERLQKIFLDAREGMFEEFEEKLTVLLKEHSWEFVGVSSPGPASNPNNEMILTLQPPSGGLVRVLQSMKDGMPITNIDNLKRNLNELYEKIEKEVKA